MDRRPVRAAADGKDGEGREPGTGNRYPAPDSRFPDSGLDRRRETVALALAADQEAGLNKILEELFRTGRAQLPQPCCLRGRQAHSRHLTELRAGARREVVSSGVGRVYHADFSAPKILHFGCHGWLTNIRRFHD